VVGACWTIVFSRCPMRWLNPCFAAAVFYVIPLTSISIFPYKVAILVLYGRVFYNVFIFGPQIFVMMSQLLLQCQLYPLLCGRVFYNESCAFPFLFFMMSPLLGLRHFGTEWCARDFRTSLCNPYGVLGVSTLNGSVFWLSCSFVTCKSHVVGEGRPSKTGVFLRSMCLK